MIEEKFIDKEKAEKLLELLGDKYTVIKNPDYVHPDFEICPMAEKIYGVRGSVRAFVMDMDGTTTTTEVLCLHSLEYMVRLLSGNLLHTDWDGLDELSDYPHIIGNSTTKHVEFLIRKYDYMLKTKEVLRSFIHAALWTLINGKDEKRREEVSYNVINLKLEALLSDDDFVKLSRIGTPVEIKSELIDILTEKYESIFDAGNFNSLVRVGIDVYYHRYHQILEKIKAGDGLKVSAEIFRKPGKYMIEPMPGVFCFLSLIKGWLSKDDIKCLIPFLLNEYTKKTGNSFTKLNSRQIINNLQRLAEIYQRNPAKTALVTSSIFYEADIVMKELMRMLIKQIANIDLPSEKKEFLMEMFSNYNNVYDAFITASDSSEIRLKPHRDLYSIALHKLNITKNEFSRVAGFEDSESGTIAIRTAGIGLCIALPFAQTREHNLNAASHICEGGLPEVLLKYKLFEIN